MRFLVLLHRWLGIGLCLFFTMWFASGLVMMYVPFPALPDSERLASLDSINAAAIRVAPAEAAERCGPTNLSGLRLLSINKRPAYVCHFTDLPVTLLFADDDTAPPVPDIARPDLVGPFHYDQWVVHQRFDPYRPFYRHDLNDNAGTQRYVSSLTGEVLQQTTRQQRTWNYLGAVVHWIYPTVIRQNWQLWDQTVWWLSLAGMVSVALGLFLGVKAMLRARQSRREMLSPYRSWLRWHHILGLFTGVIVLSWIFSGWLSMDHGRLFSTPDPTANAVTAFRGGALSEALTQISLADLTAYPDVKEISFHAVAGHAIMQTRRQQEHTTSPVVGEALVREAAGLAWPDTDIAAVSIVPENDIYTSLREGSLPDSTYRVTLDNKSDTWIHVDSRNGEIISVMDSSRRTYRWLYNGLHSLDFPGLVDNRPLWITMMTLLLSVGLAFSATGVVISVRHLLRTTSRTAH